MFSVLILEAHSSQFPHSSTIYSTSITSHQCFQSSFWRLVLVSFHTQAPFIQHQSHPITVFSPHSGGSFWSVSTLKHHLFNINHIPSMFSVLILEAHSNQFLYSSTIYSTSITSHQCFQSSFWRLILVSFDTQAPFIQHQSHPINVFTPHSGGSF